VPIWGTQTVGRRFRRQLAVVTAVGAGWRLSYLFVAKADQRLLLNDSLYYSIQAGLNSEGRWFKDALTDQPGAEHGPLTSLYLTPWSLGGGDGVFRQRLAMTLLGIATVAVIGLVGRRLGSLVADGRGSGTGADGWLGYGGAERVGIAAAVMAAAYPNLWINDSLVMSESLAVLLVSLALLVALGHHRHPTLVSGAGLGLIVGLGALTRSEVAIFGPAFALLSWAVCRRRRLRAWPALAIVAAAVMTLVPWTVYNAGRFAEPVLLSTNDGNTLLGANCDITYFDDVGGWDLLCLGPLEVGSVGHEPGAADASQRSTERRRQGLEYIGDHVGRLPVVRAARVGRALDVYGLGSLVRLDVGEEKAEWAVWAGIVSWWALAVLAVGGWQVLRRRSVAARGWLMVPAAAVLVTTVLFYGAHRIRAPAEPTVVVLAAVAVAGATRNRWVRDGPSWRSTRPRDPDRVSGTLGR